MKKILFGTTASLLLAGGFATSTASANENNDTPTEEITESTNGNGIRVPMDINDGDTYEKIVDVEGKDFTYTITKVEAPASSNNTNDFSAMNSLPVAVDVTETAWYEVGGGFEDLSISFLVQAEDGLIVDLAPSSYFFGVGVDFANLNLHNDRFASYDFGLSAEVEWIGGPSTGVGLRARMVSSGGANTLINYLETEVY